MDKFKRLPEYLWPPWRTIRLEAFIISGGFFDIWIFIIRGAQLKNHNNMHTSTVIVMKGFGRGQSNLLYAFPVGAEKHPRFETQTHFEKTQVQLL